MRWLGRTAAAVAVAGTAWFGLGGVPPLNDAARIARIDSMYADYRREFPGVPEIDAPTLRDALARGAPLVLVDVREPAERAVSTLPGAIPAAAVEADPAAYAGKTLVAYCTIGYRSGLWASTQRDHGLSVENLAGSILAWTHAGGALIGPDGAPTRRVHVYGSGWDLARIDYTAVW